jgi:CRP/FNR family transcriptional regulator, cyclic AMP receptor protein
MDVRDDVVEIISGFSLFAGLSSPELDLIARVFEEAWFGEGERILRQGFTGSGFYIILEGTAVIQVDGVKRDALRPGDFFGEISCLLGVPPTADIVAERSLRCLVMPAPQLEGFLVANPRVMYRVLQGEARKLRSTIGWHS